MGLLEDIGGWFSSVTGGQGIGSTQTQQQAQPPQERTAPPQQSNPVTEATQYYNQNYNVTTPGYTQAPQAPYVPSSMIREPTPQSAPVQQVQSAPAQRFDPVQSIQSGFGAISQFGGEIGQKAYLAGASYGTAYSKAVNAQPAQPIQQIQPPSFAVRSPESQIDYAPAPAFNQTPQQAPRGDFGTTSFVPGGKAGGNIAIEKSKMIFGETAGDVGFFQVPKSVYENEGFTRKYGWVSSSGGPGALQSGKFGPVPLAANVYTQESGGTKLDPKYSNMAVAALIEKNPTAYPRMGAEAYGGVRFGPLDNRTLQSNQEMGRYATPNYANLVNPTGVNQPKQDWETIPWSMEWKGAPNIQRVDLQGKLSQPSAQGLASIGMTPAQNIPVMPFDLGSIRAGASNGNIPMQMSVAPPGVYDAGVAGMPVPFRSPGTDKVTITKPTGDLPFVGQVPFISPALAYFQPEQITIISGGPKETRQPGLPTTFEYIGSLGIPERKQQYETLSKQYESGLQEYTAGGSKDVGLYTKLQSQYSALEPMRADLEKRQNVAFQIESMQNMGDFAKQFANPQETKVVEGRSEFTKLYQANMPSPTQANLEIVPSPINTFLAPGEFISKRIYESQGFTPLETESMSQTSRQMIPGTSDYLALTYKNWYENPAVGLGSSAIAVAMVGTGTVLRGAGAGEGLLAPTTKLGQMYMGGSTVVAYSMIGMYGSDIMKRTTGVSAGELTSQFVGTKAKGPWGVAELYQKNYPGAQVTAKEMNRIATQELTPMLFTYWGSSKIGNKITDTIRTRNMPEIKNPKDAMYMIDEGYPTHPRITTGDLADSFQTGTITLKNPADIANTVMQPGQTPIQRIPVGTQIGAPKGRSYIYSGAEYPFLNQGYVGAGHSEIPNAMFTSPEGLSYFTKAGSQGGFGISNDILGIYRLPTMYRINVKKGQYQEIPQSILNTPTRGMGANDPMNPRNIAINEWMNTVARPGVPVVGQYGKAEWQFEISGGSVVSKGKTIGFYRDAGARIPVIEVRPTGTKSPDFIPGGITRHPITGLPMWEVGRVYGGGGAVPSSSGVSSSKNAPMALSAINLPEAPYGSFDNRITVPMKSLSEVTKYPSVSKPSYPAQIPSGIISSPKSSSIDFSISKPSYSPSYPPQSYFYSPPQSSPVSYSKSIPSSSMSDISRSISKGYSKSRSSDISSPSYSPSYLPSSFISSPKYSLSSPPSKPEYTPPYSSPSYPSLPSSPPYSPSSPPYSPSSPPSSPITPITPPPTFLLPPGGGTGSGYGQRGVRSWVETNPTASDFVRASGGNFRMPRFKGFKKFKFPKF
jgi:hypothetical protein